MTYLQITYFSLELIDYSQPVLIYNSVMQEFIDKAPKYLEFRDPWDVVMRK